jgi:hypothetical protein
MKKKVVFSLVIFLLLFCSIGFSLEIVYPELIITEPTEVFGSHVYSRCLIDAPVTIAQINNTAGTGYWNLKCLDYLEITENAYIDGTGRGWRGGLPGTTQHSECWYYPQDGQHGEGEFGGSAGYIDSWVINGYPGNIGGMINNFIKEISDIFRDIKANSSLRL